MLKAFASYSPQKLPSADVFSILVIQMDKNHLDLLILCLKYLKSNYYIPAGFNIFVSMLKTFYTFYVLEVT